MKEFEKYKNKTKMETKPNVYEKKYIEFVVRLQKNQNAQASASSNDAG